MQRLITLNPQLSIIYRYNSATKHTSSAGIVFLKDLSWRYLSYKAFSTKRHRYMTVAPGDIGT